MLKMYFSAIEKTNLVENWCFKREIWEIKREIWEIKREIWEINVDAPGRLLE